MKVVKENASDSSEFLIDVNDTLVVFTLDKNINKDCVNNIISKIIIINEPSYINLNSMSEALGIMEIKGLNIISVDLNNNESNTINMVEANKGCVILYTEMAKKHFIKYLDKGITSFFNYNKHSLYIIKGGNYFDIKNLFSIIDHHLFNIGKGGSQKSHVLSPLDLRLSCYLMAMFNFNHKLISRLNTFNYMSKDRYLSWLDLSNKNIRYL